METNGCNLLQHGDNGTEFMLGAKKSEGRQRERFIMQIDQFRISYLIYVGKETHHSKVDHGRGHDYELAEVW